MFAGEATLAKCSLHILPGHYASQLGVYKTLSVEIIAEVKDTTQKFKHCEEIRFCKPSITVSCSQLVASMGHPVELQLIISNPRAVPLTNSSITVESEEHLVFPINRNCGTVNPRSKMMGNLSIPTKTVGDCVFVVVFSSAEVEGLRKEYTVRVVKES